MHEVLFSCEPFSVFGTLFEILYSVVVVIDSVLVFIEFGLQLPYLPVSFCSLDEALFSAADKHKCCDKTGYEIFVEQISFVFPYEVFQIHVVFEMSVQKYKFFSEMATL